MSSLNYRLCKEAKNDVLFIKEMGTTKNNKMPILLFASEIEIAVWAACYYGWMVGRYSVDYADSVKASLI